VARHEIRYSEFNCAADASFPNGQKVKRPILPIHLVNGGNRLTCYGIVDSGEDHCTFPLSFALQLGLDPLTRAASEIAGVGSGAVPTFYWTIGIEIPTIATLEIYAGFTSGLEGVGLGLLGQFGFFDRAKVEFDHRAGLFAIEI
jgi:hypothetical protein